MNTKRILSTLATAVFGFFLCAESVKIDMRLNTAEADTKNHLTIKAETAGTTASSTTATKTKDSYDAVSGASRKHSTKSTASLMVDSSNKKTMPKGLRALALFSVSDFRFIEKDGLKIERDKENPKKLTITFSHRGNSYKIETDEKGTAHVNFQKEKNGEIQNSFKIKKKDADTADEKNGKNEESKENPGKDVANRQKIDTERGKRGAVVDENAEEATPESGTKDGDGFENDGFDDTAQKVYSGRLNLSLKSGIFKMKGTLKLVEKPEQKKEEPEEKKDGQEPEETEETPGEDGKEGSTPEGTERED